MEHFRVFFPQHFLDLNKIKHSNNNCVKEKSVFGQLLISEKASDFLVYLYSLVEHSWMMDNISLEVKARTNSGSTVV